MQPQSEFSKSKHKAAATKSSSNIQQPSVSTATPTTTTNSQTQRNQNPVKVIKGKKPLCHFKFYLDIRDHQLTKNFEEQIKTLGGALEFFLSASVTHFVTDKTVIPASVGSSNNNNNNSRPSTPHTPATPATPQTPYSLESYDGKNNDCSTPGGNRKSARPSRADAILNRARRQSNNVVTASTAHATANTNVNTELYAGLLQQTAITAQASSAAQPYLIWQTEYALRFLRKVQHELRDYLQTRDRKQQQHKAHSAEPIHLKGGFIKIEAIKRNFRPYYQLFKKPTEWPKIEITRDDGAFRLSPKKSHTAIAEGAAAAVAANAGVEEIPAKTKKMTRKSRSRSSQRQQQQQQQQQQQLLPAAVQALKKGDATAAKTSAGGGAGGVGCKQTAKETSDKQCGVCEICKIEYDTLTIHLKTKDHEYFAKNTQNFIALDTLIHASADVNKFLDETKKIELKSELEEMEVEEHFTADIDAPDPLEHISEPLSVNARDEKHSACAGISPTLREKSKRSTKGKHSSEKFQHAKLPKTPPKTATTTTTITPHKTPALLLENNVGAAVAGPSVITPYTARRKASSAAAISPPIRAMLPPSSLYKVVETQEICTPTRKARDADANAVASPSIIVKFKKLRQTELHRLNGEAENFMFPKQRKSSELPTDTDRQTTSENARASRSSISLDSSSELMDVDTFDDSAKHMSQQQQQVSCGKKAFATAKRRKVLTRPEEELQMEPVCAQLNALSAKQSFPSAPIQPEIQLKRLRKSTTDATAAHTTFVAAAAGTANITLPEATRKSSRTATAIVSAATTSSRLLRAAVEAAKHNNRRLVAKSVAAACHSESRDIGANAMPTVVTKTPTKADPTQTRSRMAVVKMEDGMGDYEAQSDVNCNVNVDDEDDDDLDDDDVVSEMEIDEDDDDDEDYVNHSYHKRCRALAAARANSLSLCLSTREQRAARRQVRRTESGVEHTNNETPKTPPKPAPKQMPAKTPRKATAKTAKQQAKTAAVDATTPRKCKPQRIFDYTKSRRVHELRYAFERLPTGDLWYRVFARQDACKEEYFEYYGSTKYRKLPYELGPIPFERALYTAANCCKLCSKSKSKSKTESKANAATALSDIKVKEEQKEATSDAPTSRHELNCGASDAPTKTTNGVLTTACAAASTAAQYAHKHKKLHLLQRYQREQQELLQQKQHEEQQQQQKCAEEQIEQKTAATRIAPKCESKMSTPERERERAGSTHSTASSCASSTATFSKKQYRNKHLNRAAFLNLELPPRKSPREHASTLALVCGIIKQRQDSQSKPSSEVDEPVTQSAPTPTPLAVVKEQTPPPPPPPQTPPIATPKAALRSPRSTRSAAATPVEELRFATEISENVKRLRRGQNKYDHSPPIVLHANSRARRGRPSQAMLLGRRLHYQHHSSQSPNTVVKRRKRKANALCAVTAGKQHSYGGAATSLPSIRKTGSKKGVLEFEVDASALKALDDAATHTNVRQLEWEIDKYLLLAGKDYDLDANVCADGNEETLLHSASIAVAEEIPIAAAVKTPQAVEETPPAQLNTPPPTDCFSSDFDLCDLFISTPANVGASDDERTDRTRKNFSLYNSVALHNYFRRRKNLKSNRTGWPKVQKKKQSARQQQLHSQKIRFLKDIGELGGHATAKQKPAESNKEDNNSAAADEHAGDADVKDRTRGSGVITPPDSDNEDDAKTLVNEDDADVADDDTELDAAESLVEEDDAETMADSVEDEHEADADVEADADEEEVDDDDDDDDDDDVGAASADEVEALAQNKANEDDVFEPSSKRARRATIISPVPGKLTQNTLSITATHVTSTPTKQMLRGLRRTPQQLNGSLGSCISPSEKAGDNSDIFTVSSDGLDTDLDISNSQHHHHHSHHHHAQQNHNHSEHCANFTPKRKYDLAKYAPNNSATSDAATAAVKSLAISQFLKKEVRVTCRRLRAPFRRFRYRR